MIDRINISTQTAAYYTLGCKLNFAETGSMAKELAALGIRKASVGEAVGICIINTCSVTELADKKSRQLIRRMRKLYPDALLIVTGCYAQLRPDEVAQIEGVDLIIGHAQKSEIGKYILSMLTATPSRTETYLEAKSPKPETRSPKPETRNPKPEVQNSNFDTRIITSPADKIETFIPSCSAGDRTRHFLKVQDGCDYCCSYCTVPYARGRSRNGSIDAIIAQAEKVAEEGGREIVLTGVNTGDFGKSTQESFIDLLRALDQVEDIARYRISSIEPNLITDEIIDFVAGSRHFAPHFHIPLQSGSDTVLRLMRRRYDTALFHAKINRIKTWMPDAFIGVDVITGMRGETDACFEESLAFIQSLPVSQLHVFTYSERPGTEALRITPVVSPEIKHVRSNQLLALSDQKRITFYESQIGKPAQVLFEHTCKGKSMYGFTANYIRTVTPYCPALINQLTDVRLTGWNKERNALTISLIT